MSYANKATALETLDVFVESTDSGSATRDAILMEVTRAIFSHQPTGYLKSSQAEAGQSSVVMEVLKNVSHTGKAPD